MDERVTIIGNTLAYELERQKRETITEVEACCSSV